MKKLAIDQGWRGMGGIGRFAEEVSARIPEAVHVNIGSPVSPLNTFKLTYWLLRHRGCYIFSPGYNAPLFLFSRFSFVVHDLNHLQRSENSSLLKRFYYNFIVKRACRKAATVFTVSGFTAEQISKWAQIDAAAVEVVGNGVSAAFSPNGPKFISEKKYFFCVGNRKGHKNEKAVLEAFRIVAESYDCVLYFSGMAEGPLVDHIRECKLTEKVFFTGRLNDEQLAAYYRGARASIFLSLYEGFGLPVIESMACGTPVVAAAATSIPEVAGDAAWLVDPHCPNQAADALIVLMNDDKKHHMLRLAGLARSEFYNWEIVSERVRRKLIEIWKLES